MTTGDGSAPEARQPAVIEQACQHAATWPATTEDGAPPAVSVNLSSRDFDGSQLPSVIASALQ
ncbi:MAG TPA: hypothetical protein VE441_03860, partial [Mycobacterium sp.]|nr:hypothetical protein [Mycobacterium sp.]